MLCTTAYVSITQVHRVSCAANRFFSLAMMPADQSAYITSVWAFMTAKWTLMLFLFAQKAKRVVQEYLPINGF